VLTYKSTLRAPTGLRPCWTDLFEQPLVLLVLLDVEWLSPD